MSESPWTKKEIIANLIFILILMVYATIILLIKSWLHLPVYWTFWILYLVVGRYGAVKNVQSIKHAKKPMTLTKRWFNVFQKRY